MRPPDEARSGITIRFDRGNIDLALGTPPEVDLVITIDFNDPDAKPKVKGALTHLTLALAVAKVLEPPVGTWQEEAQKFWAFASDWPRMPKSFLVVCTDDGTELRLGDPSGAPEFELHGTGKELTNVLSGNAIITEQLLDGKLSAVYTLEHASVLTGRSIAWVMGEGR